MEFYAGSPLVLYVWIYLIHYVASYDQLVNTTKTKVESSSTYTYGTYSGSADKTIDKNFDQDYRNCMHTAPGRKRAWLRIDLGDYFNLKSVKIWYRSDKNRRTDHNTKRLKGFSIFASYTPNVDKKYICYQDPGNKTLHTVLEVDCTRIARYVTIFNDKMNDPVGVFLEICEVEIYGCPRHEYGEKCARCDMCKYECDITGRCDTQGCKEGYLPPFCKECDDGTFGYYCRGTCSGHCARKVPCNKANGTCPGGCADGWQNVDCNEKCNIGFHGKDCQEKCGHCRGAETCHHINGSCPVSCKPGYQGENCKRGCNMGFYGKNCQEKCGHCRGAETCHHIKGSCPGLCEPGYQGENCKRVCNPGWYGRGCRDRCSHCGGNETCHHVNGSCLGLCQPGYQQEKCNEPCNAGWYGRECKERCGYCRGNKPCHHVTGSCLGLCEPGYSEEKCVFSQHLANQGKIIKLISELVAYKRRKAELRENGTSPTDFK